MGVGGQHEKAKWRDEYECAAWTDVGDGNGSEEVVQLHGRMDEDKGELSASRETGTEAHTRDWTETRDAPPRRS